MNEKIEAIQPQENKMGIMPVNRLLITVSAPIMLSMLVQALYNIVDGIFVSHLSQDAFNAVSLAFPVQSLMVAVAVGTGVGVNAFLSRSLGEKEYEKANQAATNGIFLECCSYIIFALFGIFGSGWFFRIQTDVPEIVEGGTSYLSICMIFSIGFFIQIIMERLLQATGQSVWSMAAQLLGAVINIVLDPLFIFTLDMGITGAAIATVIGQLVGMVFSVYLNVRKNTEISLSMRRFRPDPTIIRSIYAVGIPSIVMQAVNASVIFLLNQILLIFSTTATAVLGAYFKLQSFLFMPVFGLNNGLIPIVAYNFGAKKPDRMVKAVKLGLLYSISIMLIGFLAFQLWPDVLLLIFDASANMMEIGIPALRTVSFCFGFAGFGIIISGMFQALNHGCMSLAESLIRQVVVLLPVARLFAQTGRLELVWLAFPLASIAATITCLVFLRRIYRIEIKPMMEQYGKNRIC